MSITAIDSLPWIYWSFTDTLLKGGNNQVQTRNAQVESLAQDSLMQV